MAVTVPSYTLKNGLVATNAHLQATGFRFLPGDQSLELEISVYANKDAVGTKSRIDVLNLNIKPGDPAYSALFSSVKTAIDNKVQSMFAGSSVVASIYPQPLP